jgi:hypothetical protein
MSILEGIKKTYNNVIIRRDKADEFYNNPNISQEKKDKWLPEYLKIINQLSVLITSYEKVTGQPMSKDEIWNGFKEVG